MKKIIRLTESDLTRIVKRVIEEEDQKMKIQLVMTKAKSCFDSKKYKKLYSLMKGTLMTVPIFVVLVACILVPEGAIFLLPLLPGGLALGSQTYKEFKEAFESDVELKKEAISLLKCVGLL